MAVNIEQLIYIIEVDKAKSLANASKTLNVSQSALSQAITRIESELHLKLFERNRSGVITTKEGERIIEKAQNALQAIYQIKEEAYRQVHNPNDLLRISTIPGITGSVIDTYLTFRNKNSHLKIEVSENGSMKILEDMKQDKIDIGFIAINKTNMDLVSEFHFTPVLDGKLLVFTSKNSPIVNTKKTITAEQLRTQTFVLYKDEYVEDFIAHFQRLYGPIDIFFKTTNLELINKAIFDFGAITVGHDVSAKFIDSYSSNNITALDIINSFDTSYRFGWVLKKGNKLSTEAKSFVEKVNEKLVN